MPKKVMPRMEILRKLGMHHRRPNTCIQTIKDLRKSSQTKNASTMTDQTTNMTDTGKISVTVIDINCLLS